MANKKLKKMNWKKKTVKVELDNKRKRLIDEGLELDNENKRLVNEGLELDNEKKSLENKRLRENMVRKKILHEWKKERFALEIEKNENEKFLRFLEFLINVVFWYFMLSQQLCHPIVLYIAGICFRVSFRGCRNLLRRFELQGGCWHRWCDQWFS